MMIRKNHREGMVALESLTIEWVGWAIAAGHKAFNNHRPRKVAWLQLQKHEKAIKKQEPQMHKALYLRGLITALDFEIKDNKMSWDKYSLNKKRLLKKKHLEALNEILVQVDYKNDW